MKKLIALLLILSSSFSVELLAQTAPSTDIFVFNLFEQKRRVKLSEGKNVTDRDGYDNQPHFIDANQLLYTSQMNGQTDIILMNLTDGTTSNVTNTPESEYSAHMLYRSKSFVVVRVEADNKQRLWKFDLAGKAEPELMFEDIEPVGYQAWAATEVAMFVLGDPVTLVMNSTKTPNKRTITEDIGRTIKTQGRNFIIQKEENGYQRLYRVAGRSGKLTKVTTLPRDADGWAVTPAGSFLATVGSKVWKLHPAYDSAWKEIADLDSEGINKVTRLSISTDNTKIALVVER